MKFFNHGLISIAPSHNAILEMAFYHGVMQQKYDELAQMITNFVNNTARNPNFTQ